MKKDFERTEELLELSEDTSSTPADEHTEKSKKITRKKKIIIGIITVIIVIVAAAVGVYLYQQQAEITKQLELGQKYLDEGKYDEAILAFDAVIAIDPKETDAYEGKGDAYIGLKQYDQAEETLKQSQSIEKTVYSDVLMADVYVNTKREDEAKELLNAIDSFNDEPVKTVIRASDVLTEAKDYDKAIEHLKNKVDFTDVVDEQKQLFDKLIELYIKAGKSEDEIIELLEWAVEKTGDTSYMDRKEELLVKNPTFDPAGGEYKGELTVTIKKGDAKDKVYYTTDGSEPTNKSQEYTAPFTLSKGDHVVQAVEYTPGGTKGKVQKVEYSVVMTSEETFINNIKGSWQWERAYSDIDGNKIDKSFFQVTDDRISENNWLEILSGKRAGDKEQYDRAYDAYYRVLSVNEAGTAGTIEVYGGKIVGNVESLINEIDCGALGDGKITINGKEYSYVSE